MDEKDTMVSIVIPSYNSLSTLPLVLYAASGQVTDVPFETIVVDSSPDASAEKLCDKFENVRCIHLEKKTLPGIARNIGAKESKGDLIIFCDADVILDEGAVEQSRAAYERGHRIFGGALEIAKASRFPTGYVEHFFFNHEAQPRRPEGPRKNLSSALMAIDRQVFLKSGGFKEIPRMQDTELTERLVREGSSLAFIPAVLGYQIQDTGWKALTRKVFVNGINLYSIRYAERMTSIKRVVFLAASPMLGFLKASRIIARHLRYLGTGRRLQVLLLCPAVYWLGFVWSAGLAKGLITRSEISSLR